MKWYTKLIGIFGAATLCYLPQSTLFTQAQEAEVLLNGQIIPLMLDFTVPSDIQFTVNPNATDPDQVFVSPEFVISNESGAPLSVSISAFENSNGHVFNDVLPSEHNDWTTLGATESNRDLALGIDIDPSNDNQWYPLPNQATGAIYAKQVQDSSTPILIGGIQPNSSIKLGLTAHHGYSFTKSLTTQYRLTLIFDLI